MTTFFTAILWGLGVSVGASIGLLLLFTVWALLKPLVESKEAKAIGELSLAALNRRNELTEEQICALRRIADVMEEAHK